MCKRLAQGRYSAVRWPGVEPATSLLIASPAAPCHLPDDIPTIDKYNKHNERPIHMSSYRSDTIA